MAFWSKLFTFGIAGRRNPGLQQSSAGSYNVSNVVVNEDTALKLSAVWACVRLLAETVGGLPVNCYRNNPDGSRELDNSHPLAVLFNSKPNKYQNHVEFFETMTMQLALHGNAYAVIQKTGGRIISLMPMMAEQMEVTLLTDGSVVYRYVDGANVTVFAPESIWHIKLMSNGIVGLSPLAYARTAIGVGIASEDRVKALAKNGFKPTGILTIDKLLKPEQRTAIRQQFADLAEGGDDPLRVLEAGMQYQQISMNPKDVQLLETRRFQIEDIARFFGVPSVLINDTSASTVWGSGVEQIVQGFYKLGLRPYLERYEASIKNNLLSPNDRSRFDFEFDFAALLRGDEKTRFNTYKEAVLNGLKTINECRRIEGLPSIEGGDIAYMQGQMTPITDLGRTPEPVEMPDISGIEGRMDELLRLNREKKQDKPMQIDLRPEIRVESSPVSLTLKQDGEVKKKSLKLIRDEKGTVLGAETIED
jgi:HK97 family phage portal protein